MAHLMEKIHPHHDKVSGAADQAAGAKNSAEQDKDAEGHTKVEGGSWDPSGKDVANDTVENRNAETPHPSFEQDKAKMEKAKKDGLEDKANEGGNKGRGDVMDK